VNGSNQVSFLYESPVRRPTPHSICSHNNTSNPPMKGLTATLKAMLSFTTLPGQGTVRPNTAHASPQDEGTSPNIATPAASHARGPASCLSDVKRASRCPALRLG
jgi:hypothetical protein